MFRSKPARTGTQPDHWAILFWGDLNNDGLLDLLVPNHQIQLSGGPYIYLHNGNGTFTDVISTSGSGPENPGTQAWQGISFGDYDADGNLDIFISEPPYGARKAAGHCL